MERFDVISLEELTGEKGFACDCGKHHVCHLKYLNISKGAIAQTAEMVSKLGCTKPFVVCDENTYRAAGEQVCKVLAENGMPYTLYVIPQHTGMRISPAEWEVGSVVFHLDPSCDLILAVGSGVVNDICKVVAHAVHLPNAVVGTAPSMDGYASNSSSMEVSDVKTTLYNQAPSGILLDTAILAQAPMRMLWAGLGDMIAKYIAVCEWRIAHLVIDEYYCENVASLMRRAVEKVVSSAEGIANRDADAIGAVAEGLVIAGIGMAYAQVSRPASGLEHYFSHMWEMMALERKQPYDLHGIQVGVGTVLTMKLYDEIRRIKPDKEKALASVRAFDQAKWEQDVHRIFGATADEIIKIEEKSRKNDPEKHRVRLDKILENWDEILKIINEELPSLQDILQLLEKTGMPMRPSDIDISMQDTLDAFMGIRDVRDKYMSSSLLWDLGLMDEFKAILEKTAEA